MAELNEIEILIALGRYLLAQIDSCDENTHMAWIIATTWWLLANEHESRVKRGMSKRQETALKNLYSSLSNAIASRPWISEHTRVWMCRMIGEFEDKLGVK